MFGIDNFEPVFCESADELITQHGKDLRRLLGQRNLSNWVLWNKQSNQRLEEWPIILVFEEQTLELCVNNDNQLSATWNTIDVSKALFSNADGAGDGLFWKEDALPHLVSVKGQRLKEIKVVEYQRQITVLRDHQNPAHVGKTFSSYWLLIGLEFQFEQAYLSVWNALSGIEIDAKLLRSGEYGAVRKISI